MSSAKERGELTITLRMKGRPVVLVGEGDVAEEQRSLLKRSGAFIVAEGSKATFAVVVDDPAAVSRLKVRGCLVYAVGKPELSDFTLASPAAPAAPSRLLRKPESASAKPIAAAAEPVSAADPAPEITPPPPALKLPKVPKAPKPPRPKLPRPAIQLPQIRMPQFSFAPVIGAAGRIGSLGRKAWTRIRVLVSPALRISTPFTRTVSSMVQARIDRARERPISLDIALVKGGLLDHLTEPRTGDQPESALAKDQAAELAPLGEASSSGQS